MLTSDVVSYPQHDVVGFQTEGQGLTQNLLGDSQQTFQHGLYVRCDVVTISGARRNRRWLVPQKS